MARVTARAAVMQMIYEHLAGGEGGEETLQMVYDQLRRDGVPGVDEVRPSEPGEGDRAYIARVLGVYQSKDQLDQQIGQHLKPGWTVERLTLVEKNILRLGIYEMTEFDTPQIVAVNEAVELANRYSEPTSGRFINGVLGTILRNKEAAE